jgi:2-oxo-4-hydroxy-4-carboxy--5-ureidoimidazoline (OHCU) decarboxylase
LWVEPSFERGTKKVGKIKQVVEKLKTEENLTTSEVLTKYPDLARLLEQEEQKEKLNESASERVLLKG